VPISGLKRGSAGVKCPAQEHKCNTVTPARLWHDPLQSRIQCTKYYTLSFYRNTLYKNMEVEINEILREFFEKKPEAEILKRI